MAEGKDFEEIRLRCRAKNGLNTLPVLEDMRLPPSVVLTLMLQASISQGDVKSAVKSLANSFAESEGDSDDDMFSVHEMLCNLMRIVSMESKN